MTSNCQIINNNSFEEQVTAPSRTGNVGFNGPSDVLGWDTANVGSPDYFSTNATNGDVGVPNNLFGSLQPRTGNSYVGIYQSHAFSPSKREYIKRQIPTLSAGKYYAEFYAALAIKSALALSSLGLHVMANNPYYNGETVFTPLITPVIKHNALLSSLSWTKISGTFTANGNEQFLMVGNFSTDNDSGVATVNQYAQFNGAYYYIDDIALFKFPEAGTGGVRAPGGAGVTLGSDCPLPASSNATYAWTASNDSSFTANTLNITVAPATTTTYTLVVSVPNSNGTVNTSTSTATVTVMQNLDYGCSPDAPFAIADTRQNPAAQALNFQIIFQSNAGQAAALSYEWYLNGLLVSDIYHASFTKSVACGSHNIGARVLTALGWSGVKTVTFQTC